MRGTMMVTIRRITSAVLCVLLLACAFGPLTAIDVLAETAGTQGSRIIVSLGDSYASGEGIEPFYGQNKSIVEKLQDQDWLAHRSEKSWSGRLTLDGVSGPMSKNCGTKWYFVASSGAETVHLKEKKQYKYFNTHYLYGSAYIDKQLDVFNKLGDQKAEYVTLSIGGNDAKFADIIMEAAMPHPINPGALNDKLSAVWNEFYYGADGNKSIRDRLFQAYSDVQAAAGRQAKIIVTGYPQLLDPEGSKVLFSEKDAGLINESVSRFNDEIETIVKACKASGMKICFVSVEEAFKNNRAYSDDPFIRKVELGIYMNNKTEDLVDFGHETVAEDGDKGRSFASSYSMHPNDKGAQAYAECVQAKINEIEKDGGRSEWPLMSSSEERDIVLVLDVSGSMNGTPIEETRKASEKFISTVLKEDASIGIVTYDSSSMCLADFCMNEKYLTNIVQNINAGGGTNMEAGLAQAYSMLQGSSARKKIIVLMSDGEPNAGKVGDELIAYAGTIKEQGIYIYTLGFFESMGGGKSSAQMLMEGIASDGCHYEVADANDLVFFFGDVADQINGQKYIYVRIACPVDVTVKYDGETLCSVEDDLNTRTSFGSLTFEENEKENDDSKDNRIKVLRLKEGVDYDIQIEGNGRGYMDYTIGFMDDTGEYSDLRKFSRIKITKRTVIDTVASVAPSTVLNVDEDGDGKYDLKYKATENSRGELVDYTYVIYIVVGAVAVILVLVIVLLIKKRKKANKQK